MTKTSVIVVAIVFALQLTSSVGPSRLFGSVSGAYAVPTGISGTVWNTAAAMATTMLPPQQQDDYISAARSTTGAVSTTQPTSTIANEYDAEERDKEEVKIMASEANKNQQQQQQQQQRDEEVEVFLMTPKDDVKTFPTAPQRIMKATEMIVDNSPRPQGVVGSVFYEFNIVPGGAERGGGDTDESESFHMMNTFYEDAVKSVGMLSNAYASPEAMYHASFKRGKEDGQHRKQKREETLDSVIAEHAARGVLVPPSRLPYSTAFVNPFSSSSASSFSASPVVGTNGMTDGVALFSAGLVSPERVAYEMAATATRKHREIFYSHAPLPVLGAASVSLADEGKTSDKVGGETDKKNSQQQHLLERAGRFLPLDYLVNHITASEGNLAAVLYQVVGSIRPFLLSQRGQLRPPLAEDDEEEKKNGDDDSVRGYDTDDERNVASITSLLSCLHFTPPPLSPRHHSGDASPSLQPAAAFPGSGLYSDTPANPRSLNGCPIHPQGIDRGYNNTVQMPLSAQISLMWEIVKEIAVTVYETCDEEERDDEEINQHAENHPQRQQRNSRRLLSCAVSRASELLYWTMRAEDYSLGTRGGRLVQTTVQLDALQEEFGGEEAPYWLQSAPIAVRKGTATGFVNDEANEEADDRMGRYIKLASMKNPYRFTPSIRKPHPQFVGYRGKGADGHDVLIPDLSDKHPVTPSLSEVRIEHRSPLPHIYNPFESMADIASGKPKYPPIPVPLPRTLVFKSAVLYPLGPFITTLLTRADDTMLRMESSDGGSAQLPVIPSAASLIPVPLSRLYISDRQLINRTFPFGRLMWEGKTLHYYYNAARQEALNKASKAAVDAARLNQNKKITSSSHGRQEKGAILRSRNQFCAPIVIATNPRCAYGPTIGSRNGIDPFLENYWGKASRDRQIPIQLQDGHWRFEENISTEAVINEEKKRLLRHQKQEQHSGQKLEEEEADEEMRRRKRLEQQREEEEDGAHPLFPNKPPRPNPNFIVAGADGDRLANAAEAASILKKQQHKQVLLMKKKQRRNQKRSLGGEGGRGEGGSIGAHHSGAIIDMTVEEHAAQTEALRDVRMLIPYIRDRRRRTLAALDSPYVGGVRISPRRRHRTAAYSDERTIILTGDGPVYQPYLDPRSPTYRRILCATYSYHKKSFRAMTYHTTAAHRCDKHLIFTDKPMPQVLIDKLNDGAYVVMALNTPGGERYFNMWQKTRLILDKIEMLVRGFEERTREEGINDPDSVAASESKAIAEYAAMMNQTTSDDSAASSPIQLMADDSDDADSIARKLLPHYSGYDYILLSGDDVCLNVIKMRRYLSEVDELYGIALPGSTMVGGDSNAIEYGNPSLASTPYCHASRGSGAMSAHGGASHSVATATPYHNAYYRSAVIGIHTGYGNRRFVSGATYVMNRQAYHNHMAAGHENCNANLTSFSEDVEISYCHSFSGVRHRSGTAFGFAEDVFNTVGIDGVAMMTMYSNFTWWLKEYRRKSWPRGASITSKDSFQHHFCSERVMRLFAVRNFGLEPEEEDPMYGTMPPTTTKIVNQYT